MHTLVSQAKVNFTYLLTYLLAYSMVSLQNFWPIKTVKHASNKKQIFAEHKVFQLFLVKLNHAVNMNFMTDIHTKYKVCKAYIPQYFLHMREPPIIKYCLCSTLSVYAWKTYS